MNILILDPANITGYCLIRADEDAAEIYDYGFLSVKDNDHMGVQYQDFIDKLQELIDDNDIHEIAHEDYFFSKFASQGANLNCAYRAMIQLVAAKNNIPYTVLNITLWKKYINGSSRPTKLQKSMWGKEPAKKLMTQESLWKRWGIKFPNHSISETTGKPIKFKYDVVDAVAMGIFYLAIYKHILNFTITKKIPDDVEFKKESKTTYKYK